VKASYAADIELARRCADGDEDAWERFVLEYRPVLYRAADALDPAGGARDLADALYGELYGVTIDGRRRPLFLYFQGRSSLATWLRAVLAQRYVDRLRTARRVAPLPDPEGVSGSGPSAAFAIDPRQADHRLPHHLGLLRDALAQAIRKLTPRDRLRLACYYAQALTLAETGRVLDEHEATVSRQLVRTKQRIRRDVERRLRDEAGMNDAQIEECFAAVIEDPGPLDVNILLNDEPASRGAVTERQVRVSSDSPAASVVSTHVHWPGPEGVAKKDGW
jgi:RNA polymerase sigma factor (sigma-70 family)